MGSLADYVTGSANVDGMEEGFSEALYTMISSMPPELQGTVKVFSAYRSPEHQARLYADAIKKYGSEAAARKWVAPPGKSNHNHGVAVDLRYSSDAGRKWMHANASRFGLKFPMAHEDWHIEPAGVRTGEYKGILIDAEAYTDGLGLTPADNHSSETQLLRFVDMVTNAGQQNQSRFRTGSNTDIVDAVDRNVQ